MELEPREMELRIINNELIEMVIEKINLKTFSSIITADFFKKMWCDDLENLFKDSLVRLKSYFDDVSAQDRLIEFNNNMKLFEKDYKKNAIAKQIRNTKFNLELIEKIFHSQQNHSYSIQEAYKIYLEQNIKHKVSLSSFYRNVKSVLKFRYSSNPLFNNKGFNLINTISKKLYVIKILDSILKDHYLIFIDEANFSMKKIRVKRWMNENSSKIIKNEGRTPGISVIIAISNDGILSKYFNYHSNNQEDMISFFRILHSRLLDNEALKERYNKGSINIVMDNARIHTGKKIREYLNNTFFKITYLPPYCPWYNGVEYLWSLIRRKFNRSLVLKG